MPPAVYVLALGIFALVTSEFVVAGLMPQMAEGPNATIPEIGYLITAFAAAMALGGPFLTVALLRMRQNSSLLLLFGIFLAGNVLAALAPDYRTMLAARVLTASRHRPSSASPSAWPPASPRPRCAGAPSPWHSTG